MSILGEILCVIENLVRRESISDSDMASIEGYLSDTFIPSTVDSFASTALSDAAAKITEELESVKPDLIPTVRAIYDKAISEFQ